MHVAQPAFFAISDSVTWGISRWDYMALGATLKFCNHRIVDFTFPAAKFRCLPASPLESLDVLSG